MPVPCARVLLAVNCKKVILQLQTGNQPKLQITNNSKYIVGVYHRDHIFYIVITISDLLVKEI